MELNIERTADGNIVLIHDWVSMAERLLGSPGRLLRAFKSRRPLRADPVSWTTCSLLDEHRRSHRHRHQERGQ
jgi:glycerophosphoryl diester phosphodiesterase